MVQAQDAVWLPVLPSMKAFGPALIKGAGSEADKAGQSVGKRMGTAIAVGIGATVGAVAAAGGALYKVGSVFSDVSTKISVGTGASGKDLDALNDAAKRVGSNIPRSFDDVAGAVVSVQTSLGGLGNMTKEQFDQATAHALNFSKAFEVDTDRVTQVVGQMMKTGLVGNANEAFDLLTSAAQKVPAAVREDVLDAVDEYGPFFKQLGIKGSDAMGMLVKSSEKGMFGLDKTGDALKEFTIRATDMSKSTATAYEALGMDQTEMTRALLEGGDKGAAAFQKIVGGLRDMKDPVDQSQAALALFGTPLEDLGTKDIPKFIASLSGGKSALGDFSGAATRMGDNVNSGVGPKLETLKNKMMVWLEPLASGVLSGVTKVFDELAGGVSAFGAAWEANDGDITSSGFPGFMEGLAFKARQVWEVFQTQVLPVLQDFGKYLIGTVLPRVMEFGKFLWDNRAALLVIAAAVTGYVAVMKTMAIISTVRGWITAAAAAQWGLNAAMTANPIGLIVAGIAALVAGLVWFFTQTDLGKEIVANAWAWIQGAVSNVVNWFQNTALPIIQQTIANIGAVFQWIYTNIILPVWTGIQTAVAAVVLWFQTVLLPGIQAVFTAVGAVFTWLYTTIIAPVFGFISTVVGGFWTLFQWIFSAVVAVIQKIVVPAIMWFWQSVIVPVFAAIGKVFTDWWNGIVMPVLNAVIGFFTKTVPDAANWLYTYGIKPVFDAIGKAISTWWNFVVKPVLDVVIGFFRDTLPAAANWLYTNGIKPVFDSIGGAIKTVWEKIIKPVFDTLSNFITKTIPKAFEDGVGFIKTQWQKLQEIAKAPVRFVVQQVINKGLIAGLNGIGGFLGLKPLPDVALPPGFADGGYTGPGGKYQPAGIVHAGEFVFTKEQTRRAGVGNLYAMANALAGYANGGIVKPLKDLFVTQGYNRTHKGIDYAATVGTPVYATQDGVVSHAGPGARAPGVWGGNEVHILGNGIETWFAHLSRIGVKLGQNIRAGQQIADSGNTGISSGPHLHFGVFRGGWPNDIDPASYLGGAGVPSGKPWNPIADIVDGLVAKFKEAFPAAGFMADLAIGAGKKLLDGAVSFVTGSSNDGTAIGAPYLHDQGGVLNPGLSSVLNATRKPEYILNSRQWADMHRLATRQDVGGGDVVFNGNVGWDPQQVAKEIEIGRRRQHTMAGLGGVVFA